MRRQRLLRPVARVVRAVTGPPPGTTIPADQLLPEGDRIILRLPFIVILLVLCTRYFIDVSWTALATIATIGAAVATLLYTRLTFAYVLLTSGMVTELQNERVSRTRPHVLVSADVQGNDLVIVVGHYGGGPARDVHFRFTPPLMNHEDEDIGARPPLATGIPLMVPGARYLIRFANHHDFQAHWGISEQPNGTILRPAKFAVVVSLTDPLANDQRYDAHYVLDLEHLMQYERPHWETIGPDDPRHRPCGS
jgi:hypothetical protein